VNAILLHKLLRVNIVAAIVVVDWNLNY